MDHLVHLHVNVSRAFLLVTFPAYLAAVRFLSSVGQQMFLQVIFGDKSLPAQVAPEGQLLPVEADVGFQVSFGGEAFATESTAEWFLSRVR